MLIQPKEITLKSEVRGEEKTYRIGYYPATEGIRLLGLFSEVVDVAARNKSKKTSGLFGDNLQSLAMEVCKYVEVQLDNGNYQELNTKQMIDAHVLDYEMLLQLVRQVHDYNSVFFFDYEAIAQIPRDNGSSKSASYKNVDGIIGVILSEGKATLKELREDYNIQDAMIMYESIMVPKINQYWAQKDAERKAKRGRR